MKPYSDERFEELLEGNVTPPLEVVDPNWKKIEARLQQVVLWAQHTAEGTMLQFKAALLLHHLMIEDEDNELIDIYLKEMLMDSGYWKRHPIGASKLDPVVSSICAQLATCA